MKQVEKINRKQHTKLKQKDMETKTELIKIRCTKTEKTQLQNRAKKAGRSLSGFCRDLFAKGKVVAVPNFNEKELEGIYFLKLYARNFTLLSNYLKNRDARLSLETKKLSDTIRRVVNYYYIHRI